MASGASTFLAGYLVHHDVDHSPRSRWRHCQSYPRLLQPPFIHGYILYRRLD